MSTWQKHTDKTLKNVVQLKYNFNTMFGIIKAEWDKWILGYNIDWTLQYGLMKGKEMSMNGQH